MKEEEEEEEENDRTPLFQEADLAGEQGEEEVETGLRHRRRRRKKKRRS